MNNKIRVVIPNKDEPWRIQVGSSSVKRKNILSAYGYVERKVSKILASQDDTKIDVIVDYGILHPQNKSEWTNEGTYSDVNKAMYAFTCFLEDYLDYKYARGKYKKYNQDYV